MDSSSAEASCNFSPGEAVQPFGGGSIMNGPGLAVVTHGASLFGCASVNGTLCVGHISPKHVSHMREGATNFSDDHPSAPSYQGTGAQR